MERNTKKGTAWGWIIFWIILFWPVGVFLLIRKLTLDKSATMSTGSGLFIASYVLMAFSAIYIVQIFDDITFLYAAIVTGAPAIWLFFKARRTRATGEKYRKYIDIIINHGESSIDNIASAMGVSYDKAVVDLQTMINAEYFVGAYIDVSQREIVLTRAPRQADRDYTAPQAQMNVVSCGSCGANNRVMSGQVVECEYCGSPLRA